MPLMSRAELHQFHRLMTTGDNSIWLRDPLKVEKMCRLLRRAQFPLRSNRISSVSQATGEGHQIPVDDVQFWAKHKAEVTGCCRQTSSFRRRMCFSALQQDRQDGEESPLEGQKKSSGVAGGQVRRQLDFFDGSDEAARLSRSLGDIFPESLGEVGGRGDFQRNCVAGEVVGGGQQSADDAHLTCVRQCCADGADFGRQISTGCPYLQCRDFERSYMANHTEIQYKFACEFVFILCCERQYYKDLYGPNSAGQQLSADDD